MARTDWKQTHLRHPDRPDLSLCAWCFFPLEMEVHGSWVGSKSGMDGMRVTMVIDHYGENVWGGAIALFQ